MRASTVYFGVLFHQLYDFNVVYLYIVYIDFNLELMHEYISIALTNRPFPKNSPYKGVVYVIKIVTPQ